MELIRTTRTACNAMLVRRSLRLAELRARNHLSDAAAATTTTATDAKITNSTSAKKRKAVFDFYEHKNKKRRTVANTKASISPKEQTVPMAENKAPENTNTTLSSPSNEVEVCISFDTTSSMYSCIREVRRTVKQTIERLLKDIPQMRIALVAHGDYGDEESTYLIKTLDHTNNKQELIDWINNLEGTYGFDSNECYELVLRDVQSLSWSPSCRNRSLVLIGDANPHPLTPKDRNPYQIDWQKEAQKLKGMEIQVYAVHALDGDFSRGFYQSLASITGGTYLKLPKFDLTVDFLCGICYRQSNLALAESYEKELQDKQGGRELDPAIQQLFDKLLGRGKAATRREIVPVAGARHFKTLNIVHRIKKIPIKTFMKEKRLGSKTGRVGFYQLTKPEMVNPKKGIVLVDKKTGEMYIGKSARMLLGFATEASKPDASKRVKPSDYMDFDIFVQSTVPRQSRILLGGTKFMYEEMSANREGACLEHSSTGDIVKK